MTAVGYHPIQPILAMAGFLLSTIGNTVEGIELPLVRYEVKTSINRVEHWLHSNGYGSHVQDGRGSVW